MHFASLRAASAMASGVELHDPFATRRLWRTSTWLDEQQTAQATPFFSKDLDSQLRVFPQEVYIIHSPDVLCKGAFQDPPPSLLTPSGASTASDGFFKLPTLEGSKQADTPDAPPVEDDKTNDSSFSENSNDADDIWQLADQRSPAVARQKTWETFLSRSISPYSTMFISEAETAVFDALLCARDDPLGLNQSSVPVVDAKVYAACLRSMALGRGSALFTRHDSAPFFKPNLPGMRISGYSGGVLDGLVVDCRHSGLACLALRSFVRSVYSRRTSPARAALASALNQVLQHVEQFAADTESQIRSLLQLQSHVRDILAILDPFDKLLSQLRDADTDEDILSLVFTQASNSDNSEWYSQQIMREILQRVSRPWIGFVEEWLGLKPERDTLLTKSNVGAAKAFIKVEAEPYLDDFGNLVPLVDFHLDQDRLPQFMPLDLALSVFETGRNLRFITSCDPDNPLAQSDIVTSSQPPEFEWRYDWQSITELESRITEYRDDLLCAIQASRQGVRPTATIAAMVDQQRHTSTLRFFGMDQGQIESDITASMHHLSQPMTPLPVDDGMGKIIHRRLRGQSPQLHKTDSMLHWSLLPMLSFGSLVSVQAEIVNLESMRLLFQHERLREHLQAQYGFQLLGNGLFCSRLAHALFDPELEPAERRAGVAMHGGIMGLRLSGRETWPPASSELRLVLMGVLTETYCPVKVGKEPNEPNRLMRERPTALPGDLSFAVRDLSQDEIDKCVNPDSLEALDFLRLSYKTPEGLAPIITPVILMRYDRIFRLLLRVLRMLHVVQQLFRDVVVGHSCQHETSSSSRRFVRESHHFISSLASYFLDIGVKGPWQAFETVLDKTEASLEGHHANASPHKVRSPDQLRTLHSSVLGQIMFRLFLRKRQQPVLKLVEGIFNLILQFAKGLRVQSLRGCDDSDERDHSAALYSLFHSKVQLFLAVCRRLTEKSRSGHEKSEEDDQPWLADDELEGHHAVAQLLMKMDMFDYYTQR